MNQGLPEWAQEDRFALSLYFDQGNLISEGIPWKDFSEAEIQKILKLHFEILNYQIIWRHKDDPAHEGGIDLECIRRKDKKKVVIAVKKKPKKSDLGQVIELSQAEADQRVYVLINGSTQSFRNQIENFLQRVEFWDEQELENQLNESHLTLKLKVDNSYANRAIYTITRAVIGAITTKTNEPFPTPTTKLMNLLWNMKDRAVTVYKCASIVQELFEHPKNLGIMSYSEIQHLVLWFLDNLYLKGLDSILQGFDEKDINTILLCTYKDTKVRSNWLQLCSYRPGLIPGAVDYAVKDDSKIQERFNELYESGKLHFDEIEPDITETQFDEASDELRRVAYWADGLEGTLDFCYHECLERICEK